MKPVRFGPVAMSATITTNILNPPTVSGGVGLAGTNSATFIVLYHIRITNKTNAPVAASLWLGGTGGNVAGTEFWCQGKSVPANDGIDWYGALRLESTDFLVGGAGAGSSLSIEGEGEIGVAG